jgi:hypothetical protein
VGGAHDIWDGMPDAEDEYEIAQQSGGSFNAASDIDMTVPDLRDMLSDKPLTPSHVAAPEKEPSDSSIE